MGWSQRFADPIPLPDGRELITLRDAGNYILSRPLAEMTQPRWQNAAEALTLVGDFGGDPMLPRIAMMQALYPDPPAQKPGPRRKRTKAYRIIR
jgi:hypothetical protein